MRTSSRHGSSAGDPKIGVSRGVGFASPALDGETVWVVALQYALHTPNLTTNGQTLRLIEFGPSRTFGDAAAYYPETNPLVPLDHVAAASNTPASKAVTVRLEPATAPNGSH